MRVYLDNAATTKVDPEVKKAMEPFLVSKYGNPSSVHSWGREARIAIDNSREKVARFFGVGTEEIVFTSCATEAINLAHKGLVEAVRQSPIAGGQPPHVITSSIEHKAVLETCQHLERLSLAEATYLPVNKFGVISLADLKGSIKENTVLISIMYVNNEVGTIQPIQKIGDFLKTHNSQHTTHNRIFFHSDATQAVQYLNCNVDDLGVDLLSFSGHKIHAPKGIGGLYIRQGTPLVRQQDGGGQEEKRRAGTENVAFAAGLAKAIGLIASRDKSAREGIKKLRGKLIAGVLEIPGVKLTGHSQKRVPHIASFTVEGVEGEAMLLLLDEEGIAVSSGSACTSGELEPSHVLLAMGIPPEIAHGSLRLSLCKYTTEKEINYVLQVLPEMVKKIRKMTPRG